MKEVYYCLVGANGRMGKAIQELQSDFGFNLFQAVTRDNPISEIDSDNVDVCIDFSSPESCQLALDYCVDKGVAFMCGTTGINSALLEKIESAGQQIPVLYAANTSLGVTFFKRLLIQFEVLRDWDYQIIESHHNQKKDHPSGTGKLLQDQLIKVLDKQVPDVLSVRGGGIFGEHTLMAMAQEEVIEIKHTALSRSLFARGALLAAKFLVDQGPGFYTMDDVLDHI